MPPLPRPALVALCLYAMTWSATAQEAALLHAGNTVPGSVLFVQAQPYSAFDMLALVPGFTFAEADADVRGFAGAAGNVLVNGARPASKHETLEAILRRIPASAVEHIEVIRSGAHGINMQGQTVLANIVRVREVQTRGSAEMGSIFYERGFTAPRVAGEVTRQSDDALLEVSGAGYRFVDAEFGAGMRSYRSPDGAISNSNYVQDEAMKVLEFAAGYERALAGGKMRLNGSLTQERFRADTREQFEFPYDVATVTELETDRGYEAGLQYECTLRERLQLELFGIHRNATESGGERGIQTDGTSLTREATDASESILRGVLRRTGDQVTVEAGIETALNALDSYNALAENGVDIPLPSASVRIEEGRGEVFAIATWRMNTQWTLEAGSRFEASELTQSGDSNVRKSFFFAKPRVLLAWSSTPGNQVRLLVEREVGQLDFGDFVSSTSLSADTVTAGNPDLEPDQTWRAELAWERHFMRSGALVLTVRHEEITDLIDRIPVAGPVPFDGVGNIGDGVRDEFEVSVDLPLQNFGMATGHLKATVLWRSSRATDPATGESRDISEDAAREASLQFTQELSQWNARWGIDVEFASATREFMFDEVRTYRFGTVMSLFAEYAPVPAWNIRLDASNLTDRPAEREREIYAGIRGSAPLDHVETQTLRIGAYAGLSVRRAFGG